jgi:hypothetical protein
MASCSSFLSLLQAGAMYIKMAAIPAKRAIFLILFVFKVRKLN